MKPQRTFLCLATVLLCALTQISSAASILHPFRRNSVDQGQLAEQSRQLNDHERRIASLEITISQLQVQLNHERRPSSSLQRRPEVRRSSRSDTSIPSLRRLPSDYSTGGVHLSPPAE